MIYLFAALPQLSLVLPRTLVWGLRKSSGWWSLVGEGSRGQLPQLRVRSLLVVMAPSFLKPLQGHHALRARAWLEHGVASLAITDIADDWIRQAVINEAVRRWGPRQQEKRHGP